ncbi:hypothetical protein IOK_04241 [Yersinia enterocolitica subsp. palearctica PhRBD_Ye1]|uniref:Uncharacterized protein n=1 Tax=Yersinia enterocolitica W22703 TaxID=913028 RepID=F4N5Y3_YEREN|nr:hypothetical protein IOK_04241 [Yersinia enterocolitica subsp. palearctica PhRBD_Ye1]CBX73491.1 unknown protein [Yersinia enterocolitica W22703]
MVQTTLLKPIIDNENRIEMRKTTIIMIAIALAVFAYTHFTGA